MATMACTQAAFLLPAPGLHTASTSASSCCALPAMNDRLWSCRWQGRRALLQVRAFSETAPPESAAGEQVYRTLYPRTASLSSGYLRVSDLHTLYYEVFGNPKGKPAVFLHGGPGAGCSRTHACFFNPEQYRVFLFDQRGCGKSTPSGCLEENTTWHLVEDIEKLREHVGVERWLVLGGSWGVTLGLAYAQTYPAAVSAVIFRGVCLLRQQEIDWFYKQGANFLFPFGWEQLLSVLEASERENVLASFYKRLTSDDSSVQESAAQQWLRWEFGLSSFAPSSSVMVWDGSRYSYSNLQQKSKSSSFSTSSSASPPSAAATGLPQSPTSTPAPSSSSKSNGTPASVSPRVAQARLECHYFMNRGFLEENQLLQNIHKIRHIPAVIVQGRFDFVCPLVNAYDLHKAWPEAKLHIVTNAGHSMYERGITHELVQATDRFFKELE